MSFFPRVAFATDYHDFDLVCRVLGKVIASRELGFTRDTCHYVAILYEKQHKPTDLEIYRLLKAEGWHDAHIQDDLGFKIPSPLEQLAEATE